MSGKNTRKETCSEKKNRDNLGPPNSVPAYESWLFEKAEWLASVMRGISQAESGELLSIPTDMR